MRTPKPLTPLWTYGMSIPHDPRAVGVVRATIRSILAAAKLNCIVDTVELLVSEVVTNAYRHSSMEAYVSMERTLEDFRVTVWDHGPGTPTPSTPANGDECGRGLGIIEACADEWGVRDYPYGKAVWFTVAPKEET
ncbi:ATP-binding protein [Streptomyces sp. NBC_00878]|uniref:ATP-binding protein n=1 Tax=Streptomyces sp. NBC_00878 TaxID=2975854 RepID=UPI0022549B37|nr:ATP-binding protein [Streptomyces sp. NBC_00878]MCX4905686.1 ATP-binding protein [Streptomyces sp. NBC_00878]